MPIPPTLMMCRYRPTSIEWILRTACWMACLAWAVSIPSHASMASRNAPKKAAQIRSHALCSSPWRGLPLAKKSDSETCRARYPGPEKDTELCVPRTLWIQWLALTSSADSPGSWCSPVAGKWRAYAVSKETDEHTLRSSRWRFRAEETPHVSEVPKEEVLPSGIWTRWIQWIEVRREMLSEWLAPHDPFGILRSSLLGESSRENAVAMLRLIGFVHLASASGIHLYAIAALWSRILAEILLALEVPALPALWICRSLVGLSWLAAWTLAGAPFGMLRPLAVVAIRRSAKLLGWKWRLASPLLISLSLELLIATLRGGLGSNSGRWFYALAVGGGLWAFDRQSSASRRRQEKTSPFKAHLAMAIGSWVFVAVFEAFQLNLIAVATPILSLICVPLICGGLYPVLFIAAIAQSISGIPFARPLNIVLSGSAIFLQELVDLSLKLKSLWVIPQSALLLGVSAGLLLRLTPTRFRFRLGISLAFLFLAWASAQNRLLQDSDRPPRIDVIQLDVGQGDAALIQAQNSAGRTLHAGLVDAGSTSALTDADWVRRLARRNVRKLDYIALTHLDEDHTGGIFRLASIVPIDCVTTSGAELSTERGKDLSERLSRNGLFPRAAAASCLPPELHSLFAEDVPQRRHSRSRPNGNMSGFLVDLGREFYMITGDATAEDEARFSGWAKKLIPPGSELWLKAGHHGSRTSSSPEFLSALRPRAVLISAGLGNPHGHPHVEVLRRFQEMSIPVYRTDRDGDLKLSGIRAEDDRRRRQEHRR